jgi:hypothetical protein
MKPSACEVLFYWSDKRRLGAVEWRFRFDDRQTTVSDKDQQVVMATV